MAEIDLLISHKQISIENIEFNNEYMEWGEGNVSQGCILWDGFVTFDPIIDDTFGAKIIVCSQNQYMPASSRARAIVVPFNYNKDSKLLVSSPSESFNVDMDLTSGYYNLYFEICEGEEGEEIYYKFTFVKNTSNKPMVPKYLIDDDFGGMTGMNIDLGLVK